MFVVLCVYVTLRVFLYKMAIVLCVSVQNSGCFTCLHKMAIVVCVFTKWRWLYMSVQNGVSSTCLCKMAVVLHVCAKWR
jgi:hypothetical protein